VDCRSVGASVSGKYPTAKAVLLLRFREYEDAIRDRDLDRWDSVDLYRECLIDSLLEIFTQTGKGFDK
jgi:hypothetical protein